MEIAGHPPELTGLLCEGFIYVVEEIDGSANEEKEADALSSWLSDD